MLGQVAAERVEVKEERVVVDDDILVGQRLVALDRTTKFGAINRFERNGVRCRAGPFNEAVDAFAVAARDTLARVKIALGRRDGLSDPAPGGAGRVATDGGQRGGK